MNWDLVEEAVNAASDDPDPSDDAGEGSSNDDETPEFMTVQEWQKQKRELETTIQNLTDQLTAAKSEPSSTPAEITALRAELSEMKAELQSLKQVKPDLSTPQEINPRPPKSGDAQPEVQTPKNPRRQINWL